MISVRLPFPPSVNNLFANAGRRRVMTPRYKAWRSEALMLVKLASVAKRIDGPYALHAIFARPDKRRRDLGNLLKAVEDALVDGGAVADDSLSDDIHLCWSDSPALDGVLVRVVAMSTAKEVA